MQRILGGCIKMVLLLGLGCGRLTAFAQISSINLNPTNAIDFDRYLYSVRQSHPVVSQAGWITQMGDLAIQGAQGAFDPQLSANMYQKRFNKKEYYTFYDAQIKLPTPYAIEGKVGYDAQTGDFINPESQLPTTGLWYAGVSVPLVSNLLIDKKRAELQQARIGANTALAQSQMNINDLLYSATAAYCEWYAAWQRQQLYRQTLTVAADRLRATQQGVKQGDRAGIDTVEARAQYQNRQFEWNETVLDATNATINLANFIWQPTPALPDSLNNTRPEDRMLVPAVWNLPAANDFKFWVEDVLLTHPELVQYNNKLRQLGIEQRLKREYLKPQIDVQYNWLLAPTTEYSTSPNNYKLGVAVAVPLRQRDERSELAINKLKIQSTRFDLDLKRQALLTKISAYYNTYQTLVGQINLYEQTVAGYQTLLNAERRRFEMGESTLLTVFMRETMLLESSIKLIDLRAKIVKAQMAVWWAAGKLQ